MTNTFKICDFVLRIFKVIHNHRKHIIYVGLISLVQVVLVLWYLNFRKPSNSLGNIEKGILELSAGQKDLKNDISAIKQQIIVMVSKDSIMDEQLQHYPSTLPLALADITSASSTYSERIDPITGDKRFHWGIDYPARRGTPVYATASGKIDRAILNNGDYGNLIRINHLNGYESLYAHLDQIDIRENDNVKRGDLIGRVGNTGKSTGYHLHYEITYMEKHINPNIFRTPLKRHIKQPTSGLVNYREFIASIK